MSEVSSPVPRKEIVTGPRPEVLTPMQFIIDWRRAVSHAKKRVYLECMSFEYGHAPGLIQQALYEAAYNGLDARANIDAFSDGSFNDEIKWIPKRGKKQFETLEALDKDMKQSLVDAGVKVTKVNPRIKKFGIDLPAKVFPFIGRNHTKIFIVDDTVWFGGLNVSTTHGEKADFVVKFQDPRIAGPLVDLFGMVNENRPEKDFRKQLTDHYALIVDRGDAGKSMILDEAEGLVGEATESIEFLSQVPPSGSLLDNLIERAKAGVAVNVVISNEKEYQSNSVPFGILVKHEFNGFMKKIQGIENIQVFHYSEGKVHGKLIIVDGKDAMFGSHNFARSGVKAGTQEACIETTDPRLIPQLQRTIDSIKDGSFDRGLKRG